MPRPTDRKNSRKEVSCHVETTLRVLGGRWKVLILYHLLDGTKRFSELTRLLKGVSARTLSKQLRELETDGVISRRVYPEVPPKVEYSLTESGRRLKPALTAMDDWGKRFETSEDET